MQDYAQNFAGRVKAVTDRCGSLSAAGRFLGVSDRTVSYWVNGIPPLPSKVMQAARASGLSHDWLVYGIGNAETELRKCRAVSIREAETARVAEDSPSISDAVRIIAQYGDPEDLKMVESILSPIAERILSRAPRGEPKPGATSDKYSTKSARAPRRKPRAQQ